MSKYEYDTTHKSWIKECSGCKTVYVGVSDEDASIEIFKMHFGLHHNKGDGFQSNCRDCANQRNTKLGITKNILEEMFNKQSDGCAICHREISIARGAPRGLRACVDHDHITDGVRIGATELFGNEHSKQAELSHFRNVLKRRSMFAVDLRSQWSDRRICELPNGLADDHLLIR